MRLVRQAGKAGYVSFSTLQCGSWIDASVNTMHDAPGLRFSTLQCGSWIDAYTFEGGDDQQEGFSTLQCGSWIDACVVRSLSHVIQVFQYPSMRVVD